MPGSQQTNYYKLGVFIIVGTALFVAGITILGAGRFFQKSVIMETYVDESVNGLEVGSPVKFRGVKVGKVSKIGFVIGKYTVADPAKFRYVLIQSELSETYLEGESLNISRKRLQAEIERGLRVRPASQGLTGQLFLEINYVDPKTNPPLKIDWRPRAIYIPSAPSTMSRVEEAINTVSEALRSIKTGNIEEAIKDLGKTAENLGKFLQEAELAQIGKYVSKNLEETRKLLARLNVLLATPKADTIIPDVSKTIAGVRHIVESSDDNIISAAQDISEAASSLRSVSSEVSEYLEGPEAKQELEKFSETLKNINEASVKVSSAAAQLHDVVRRLNGLVAGQQANIQAILENIRLILENLRELSSDAKRYPSGVLFGDPPQKAKVRP